MSRIEEFDPIELGERLRLARAAAGLSQSDACDIAGISRTTLVHTEKGKRAPRIEELVKLAPAYRTTVNRLLRSAAIQVELVPQFRRSRGADEEDAAGLAAVQLLQRLAASFAELEREVFPALRVSYPPEVAVNGRWTFEQAEDAALGLRSSLGIGLSPIPDIVGLLESEMHFRVFVRPLDSRVAGLFAFKDEVGPCVLLNSKHPRSRQDLTVAHELGHFMGDRDGLDVVIGKHDPTSRQERFATRFGLAFMMPPPAVRARFRGIVRESGGFSARQLIHLAFQFHVSPEAMARWLEQLSLVPEGTYNTLRAKGLSLDHVREVLGRDDQSRRQVTTRCAFLAAEALAGGLRTEGQLSDMLSMDRIELRALMAALGVGEGGAVV